MKKLKSFLQMVFKKEKLKSDILFIVNAGRLFLHHFYRFGHWLALAGILAIILHEHPGPILIILVVSLFVFLLVKKKSLAVSFFIVFLLIWGDAVVQVSPSTLMSTQTDWIGEINELPQIDGDQLTVNFKVHQNEIVQLVYQIKSKSEKQWLLNQLKIGMTCQVTGTLEKPDPPSNFHSFDYPTYLKHNGIHWLLNATQLSHCQDSTPGVISRIKRYRQNGITFVNERFHPPLNGIVNALVFGDRTTMNPNVITAYQNLGLVHLLAVSGLHVGIVIGLLFYLLLRLGFIKEHVSLFLLFIVLPMYAILTGLTPSVLRATLMIAMSLGGSLLKTKPPPISILSFACLVLCIVNPNVLFNIGFQLSFIIAFSIILSANTIQKRYQHLLVKTFVMTGIAQIAALPIILFNFFSISLLSFFLNIVFIPFISVIILPMTIIAVIIMFFLPSLANGLVTLMSYMIIPAHDLLLKLQNFSLFNIVIGQPNDLALFILSVCVIAVLILWEIWNRVLSALLPICFVLLVGVTHDLIVWMNPYGTVTYLDVGQGDSILIHLPHAEGTMLIDTGGQLPFPKPDWQKQRDPFDIGKDVVAHEIKGYGIKKINWLVLTHRDFDHIGALKSIIGTVPIDTIVMSDVFQSSDTEKAWFKKAKALGIVIHKVHPGVTWGNDKVFLKMLWPQDFQTSSNNRSLVLFGNLGRENWLFTGDLEKEGETGLLERYPNLHVDILKVGHHGSRTSSSESFLETIKPKLAVISVGKHNRFGHPHPDVLARYDKFNIPILRTDQVGAIQVTFTNKKVISITTTMGKRGK